MTDIVHFKPPIVGDEKFYAELSEFRWYYQTDKVEFRTAARFSKDVDVCEIGCGAGDFCRFSGARSYVGLEMNPLSVKMAHQNEVDVRLQSIEGHISDIGEQKYDVVCAFQVLEHVLNPERFVNEIVRLIRPGGHAIFSVPSENSFLCFSSGNVLDMPPHHQTRWSDKALDLLGPRHGLVTMAIIHENMDPIHANWAANAFLSYAILPTSWFRKDGELIVCRKGLHAFKWVVTNMAHIALPGLKAAVAKSFKGHSVTTVYKKPAQRSS